MMEQATRSDLKLDELIRNLEKARAESEPRVEELMRARAEAETALAILNDRRHNSAIRLDAAALRLYERVRAGRASVALAPLTPEGACGHCYHTLPLQEQAEVRNASKLSRCEVCGVILYVA